MPSSFQLNPVRNQLRHHSSRTQSEAAPRARSGIDHAEGSFGGGKSRATRRNQNAG